MTLAEELKKVVRGDVRDDEATRKAFSTDASLFVVKPAVVVSPLDAEDVQALVQFVAEKKKTSPALSLTARAGGTDMTGGPLNESVIVDFTKHINRVLKVSKGGFAVTEPGAYYRDFEKETLKYGLLLPSYPASREICAMGGIVNNNSGGERSLTYGKTERYVTELTMVLADGNEHVIKKLSAPELAAKKRAKGFEGKLYRGLHELLENNDEAIQAARPRVSKNSSGYNVWDVWDKEKGTFDLPKLFVGAQGTLGLMTEARINLVKALPHSGVLVVFLKDLAPVARIVNLVLPFKPTSFESFDDHTFRLALKFLPDFLKLLRSKNILALLVQFVPDFWAILTRGMPKLVLLVEFEGETQETVDEKLDAVARQLRAEGVYMRMARTKEKAAKYWAIRRESFNLLRHRVQGKHTAPFIDDVIVEPKHLPAFLPKLYAILDRYQFLYTVAGHAGDGNFHVIPLMTLANKSEREKIPRAAKEVYNLVVQFKGSLSAEHNDGLVRGPYLEKMFGAEILGLFREVKRIFDPDNIFNPGKKADADLAYALAHLKQE